MPSLRPPHPGGPIPHGSFQSSAYAPAIRIASHVQTNGTNATGPPATIDPKSSAPPVKPKTPENKSALSKSRTPESAGSTRSGDRQGNGSPDKPASSATSTSNSPLTTSLNTSSTRFVGSLQRSDGKTIAIGLGDTTILCDGSLNFHLDEKLALHKVNVKMTPSGRWDCKNRYKRFGRLARRQIVEFALKSTFASKPKNFGYANSPVYDDDGTIVYTQAILEGSASTITVSRDDAPKIPRTTWDTPKSAPVSLAKASIAPKASSITAGKSSQSSSTKSSSTSESSVPSSGPPPAAPKILPQPSQGSASSKSIPPLRPGERLLTEVKVEFTACPELKLSELEKSKSRDEVINNKQDFAQRLNIFLQHRKANGHVEGIPLGKDRLFTIDGKHETSTDLRSGLVAITGYSLSVGPSKPMAIIKPCAVACYRPSDSLADLMMDFDSNDHQKLSDFLTGLHIQRKDVDSPHTETIVGLATVPHLGAGSSEVRFLDGERNARTVQVHFEAKLKDKERLIHPMLPVVNVGTKSNPTYLPPEVCKVLANQVYHGKLHPDQALDMANIKIPSKSEIMEDMKRVELHRLGTVGANFKQHVPSPGELVAMPACNILATPTLAYDQPKNEPAKLVAYGGAVENLKAPTRQYRGWNLKNQAFAARPHSLESWSVVSVCVDGRPPLAFGANLVAAMKKYVPDSYLTIGDTFKEATKHEFKGVKMAMENPEVALKAQVKPSFKSSFKLDIGAKDFEGVQNLNAKVGAIVTHMKECRVRFAVVVLPAKESFLHDLIKAHLELANNIPCIFLNGPKVDRVLEHTGDVFGRKLVKTLGPCQFFANVASKLNLKLGGANQVIDMKALKPFTTDCTVSGGTLYIGLDVSQSPAAAGKMALAVAAGVVGTGSRRAQWPARFKVQEPSNKPTKNKTSSPTGQPQTNGKTEAQPTKAHPTKVEDKAKEAALRENIEGLQELIKELLDVYSDPTKEKIIPSQVVVYRNSASTQNAVGIAGLECTNVKDALDEKYGKGKVTNISFIMVGRNHSSRFRTDDSTRARISKMPKASELPSTSSASPTTKAAKAAFQQLQQDGLAAVLSNGAYVHQVRRHDTKPEFLLQAHSGTDVGNDGLHPTVAITARPTRYTIFSSNQPSDPTPNQLIELTHALSYGVGTATSAVSLCAPAHYARLASAKAIASLKVGRLVNVKKSYFGYRKSPGQIQPSGPEDPALSMIISKDFPGNHTFVNPALRNAMFYL